MKPFFTSVLVLLLTSTALFGQRRCSDLIISEITFADDGSYNYSVEIFNPTDNTVNLSGYKIELLPAQGSGISIPLSGTVPAEGVVVISNQAATDAVTTVSDILTSSLNYSGKAVLQLVKGLSTVVDRVGNQGESTELSSIDLDLLMNDPDYLDGLNINLGTLKNLAIRRKRKVQFGNQVFVNADVFENWALYLSLDYSDLGEHVNACMMPVLSWQEWEPLNEPEAIREEAGPNPTVFGTIESSETLSGDVKIFFEIGLHEYLDPPANEADNLFDYDSPIDNPGVDWTLDAGFSEFPFELCTVLADSDNQEGNEGAGFMINISTSTPTPATTELEEDLFDVLIMEGTNSTHSVELAKFIKVYPSLVQTSTTIEVSGDNMTISGASLLDARGRLLKNWEFPITDRADLDLSFLTARGMYSIVLNTSKGVTSKKILKF